MKAGVTGSQEARQYLAKTLNGFALVTQTGLSGLFWESARGTTVAKTQEARPMVQTRVSRCCVYIYRLPDSLLALRFNILMLCSRFAGIPCNLRSALVLLRFSLYPTCPHSLTFRIVSWITFSTRVVHAQSCLSLANS